MSDERNKPVDTLRDGPLKVSIFRNQGERGDFYSLSPGRLFTDNDGNTRETKSLNSSDALPMGHLLQKAHDRVSEFKREMNKDRSQDRDRER